VLYVLKITKGVLKMPEMKRVTYYYASDQDDDEIQNAIYDARDTPSGRVRGGDVVRVVLLNWAREGGKI
jgi:hypothetical protein